MKGIVGVFAIVLLVYITLSIFHAPLILLLMGFFDASFGEWVVAASFDLTAWCGSLLIWSDACLIFFLIKRQIKRRPIKYLMAAFIATSLTAAYVLTSEAMPKLRMVILEERLRENLDVNKPPVEESNHSHSVLQTEAVEDKLLESGIVVDSQQNFEEDAIIGKLYYSGSIYTIRSSPAIKDKTIEITTDRGVIGLSKNNVLGDLNKDGTTYSVIDIIAILKGQVTVLTTDGIIIFPEKSVPEQWIESYKKKLRLKHSHSIFP